MYTIEAEATEDIPAYRFMTTSLDDGSKEQTGLGVTKPDWDPDFYTTTEIPKGTVVTIDVNMGEFWEVEAGSEVEAGRPVGNGPDGKVVDRSQVQGLHTCGIATEAVQAGETLSFWHTKRVNGAVASDIIANSGGGGNQIQQLQDQLNQLETAVSNNDTAISKNDDDIAALRSDVNTNTGDISANNSEISQMMSDIQGLESRVSTLEGKVGGGGSGGGSGGSGGSGGQK